MSTTVTDKKVELIRKLIELATVNNREHEANAAALRVCRMIKENKIVLLTKDEHDTLRRGRSIPNPVYPNVRPTSSPTGRWYQVDFEEILREEMKRQEAARKEAEDFRKRYTRRDWTGFTPEPPPRSEGPRWIQCLVCMNAYDYSSYSAYEGCCATCRNYITSVPEREDRIAFIQRFTTGPIPEGHVAKPFELGACCTVCANKIVFGNLVVRYKQMVAHRGCLS